jgi:hypothetical protein
MNSRRAAIRISATCSASCGFARRRAVGMGSNVRPERRPEASEACWEDVRSMEG